ncbi:MAG: hypothetical protein ACREDJ_01355, partial [Methylocella sp.]
RRGAPPGKTGLQDFLTIIAKTLPYCEGRSSRQATVRVKFVARPAGNSPGSEEAFDGTKP